MNKEEILAMKAGRKLDRQVGKEIFSYTISKKRGFRSFEDGEFCVLSSGEEYALCFVTDKWRDKEGREVLMWEELSYYSTDISAAWLVVEKMRELKQFLFCIPESDMRYCIGFTNLRVLCLQEEANTIDKIFTDFEKLSEAICKSALIAKLEVKK